MADFDREKHGKKPRGRGSRGGSGGRSRGSSNRRSSGGRGGFGRSGGRSDRSSEKKMHSVQCAKCGEICELPFRPTGEKPTYCSDCFRKEDKKQEKNEAPSIDTHQLDVINEKLNKIMKALNIE